MQPSHENVERGPAAWQRWLAFEYIRPVSPNSACIAVVAPARPEGRSHRDPRWSVVPSDPTTLPWPIAPVPSRTTQPPLATSARRPAFRPGSLHRDLSCPAAMNRGVRLSSWLRTGDAAVLQTRVVSRRTGELARGDDRVGTGSGPAPHPHAFADTRRRRPDLPWGPDDTLSVKVLLLKPNGFLQQRLAP